MKLQFSGHETFVCKDGWLKKGHDFIEAGGRFSDESAVIDLGMGKKMVHSLNFWMKAYGLMEDSTSQSLTPICKLLLSDDGYDPYVEDLGTVWLLHYLLVTTGKASIYNIFFNEFRRGRFAFTKDQLVNYLHRKTLCEKGTNASRNTITQDAAVFIRNYLDIHLKGKKISLEDEYSNLMNDLQLMTSHVGEDADRKPLTWYDLPNALPNDLPYQIVLYAILNNSTYGLTISFHDLLIGNNSPGAVFALSEEGLYKMIENIVHNYYHLVSYGETAGNRIFQFRRSKPNPFEVLNDYYKVRNKSPASIPVNHAKQHTPQLQLMF